jgi:hypothetical protein
MPSDRENAEERTQRITKLIDDLNTETSALHEEIRTGALNQREHATIARSDAEVMRADDRERRIRVRHPRTTRQPDGQ